MKTEENKSPKSKAGVKPETKTRAPSSLRAAQKEFARQRLIDAARAVFEANGYVDVTVDDIAQRAGTSRGTFYLYFQSKIEVLRAILDELRVTVNTAGLFDDLAAMKTADIDTLQAWFEKYVDFYLDFKEIWPAIRQAQAVEPGFIEKVTASIDTYTNVWKSHGSSNDARLTATVMYTFLDQFMFLWLVEGQKLNRKQTTRALAAAVMATLSI
jgi:AcrR family transcriptional regulator